MVVNPQTRRRLMRPNAQEEVIRQDVPELRIISDDVWQQVQARLAENTTTRPERQRRPKHILSGMGVCGTCGSPWVRTTSDFWGCSRFRYGGQIGRASWRERVCQYV